MDVRRLTCRAHPLLRRWWAAALHYSSSQRCSDGRERCISQRCCDVGRQRIAACSVLPELLQQRAGCCNVAAMASNVLDLAALLRWPTVRWTSQRVTTMADSALDLATCCCDVRQRVGPRSVAMMSDNATTSANVPLQRFCFFSFFFLPDNLKREKEWEKERSFDTCSLVSRLHLSLLWLVVRNAKLPPTTRVTTVVTRSFRQQQHE